jgi:hypothetical protein
VRYIRRRTKKIAAVATARQQSRAAGDDDRCVRTACQKRVKSQRKKVRIQRCFSSGQLFRTNDLQYPNLLGEKGPVATW